MRFGVPLVSAGLTEDKADVNVRVGWSEVGINLETDKGDGQVLRDAVRTVLDTDSYRLRASLMAEGFRMTGTRSNSKPGVSERGCTAVVQLTYCELHHST